MSLGSMASPRPGRYLGRGGECVSRRIREAEDGCNDRKPERRYNNANM